MKLDSILPFYSKKSVELLTEILSVSSGNLKIHKCPEIYNVKSKKLHSVENFQ